MRQAIHLINGCLCKAPTPIGCRRCNPSPRLDGGAKSQTRLRVADPTRNLDVAHNSYSNGIGAARGVSSGSGETVNRRANISRRCKFSDHDIDRGSDRIPNKFCLTHGDRVMEIVMTWGHQWLDRRLIGSRAVTKQR